MWIFTRYGFFSIACARKPDGSLDPQTVMVRARCKRHLQALQSRFPGLDGFEIITLLNHDYRYRVVIPKDAWMAALTAIAAEQEWSNFKDETARFQGEDGGDYV